MAIDSKKSSLDLAQIARQSGFHLQAFYFVQRGLEFTVQRIHGELPKDREIDVRDTSRHISGTQLCCGLRDFAIDQYGLLARTVLRRWSIRDCEDFGRIVFAMVDAGLMHKTDNDTLADFVNVFDFTNAFADPLTLTPQA